MARTMHLDSYTQSRSLERKCYHSPFDPPTMRTLPKGSLLFSDAPVMLAPLERDRNDEEYVGYFGVPVIEQPIEEWTPSLSPTLRIVHSPVGRLIQLRISSILRAHLDAAIYEAHPITPSERSLMAIEKWAPAEDWSAWIDATG